MTSPGMHADVLLYDFGGVLIRIDFDWIFHRWAELGRVPFEQVKSRFSHGDAYQRHERGEIDIEQYFESLREDLGIDLTDEQFADGWARVFGPEYDETVRVIRELEGRVPQFLFSNTNLTHYRYWSVRYAKALEPMRRQFLSFEIGKRKPERDAFEHVARDIGVPLDRILFLDDTADNIEGAREAGVHAVLVQSPSDVRNAVAPWMDARRAVG